MSCELSKDEFEELLLKAPDIEKFETPTYFPASKNHIFHDSSRQVAMLLQILSERVTSNETQTKFISGGPVGFISLCPISHFT